MSVLERNFVGLIRMLSARSCAIYASALLALTIRADMAAPCEGQGMVFGATGLGHTG